MRKFGCMKQTNKEKHSPSTLSPHSRMFCGFRSKWAICLACMYCSAFRISRMHVCACASLSEPSSSSSACNSPPVALRSNKTQQLSTTLGFVTQQIRRRNYSYSSRIRAVSERDSCTACNCTMCFESAHSISTAISWPISRSVHCARRRRRRNLAANWTPVCLWTARRTAANLPLLFGGRGN